MTLRGLIRTRLAADAKRQCRRLPECHRVDGHEGACKTLGIVLLERAKSVLDVFRRAS